MRSSPLGLGSTHRLAPASLRNSRTTSAPESPQSHAVSFFCKGFAINLRVHDQKTRAQATSSVPFLALPEVLHVSRAWSGVMAGTKSRKLMRRVHAMRCQSSGMLTIVLPGRTGKWRNFWVPLCVIDASWMVKHHTFSSRTTRQTGMQGSSSQRSGPSTTLF